MVFPSSQNRSKDRNRHRSTVRVSQLAVYSTAHSNQIMRKATQPLALTAGDRRVLESWVRAGTTPQRVARRARIILQAADGLANRTISLKLSISPRTVDVWRARFHEGGPASLQQDAPGRGRKPKIPTQFVALVRTLMSTPRHDGRRWTVRLLAEATGMSRASTHRLLRRFAQTKQQRGGS